MQVSASKRAHQTKMITTASQRDEFLREQFISDVSVYNPDMLVFIDETGADRRNLLRSHGYSIRGKPLRNHTLLVRDERVSAVACISISGLLDVKTVTGNTDGDTFYDFVQTHLLPILQPYNGSNPHSVVIMDNCSIHHVPEVVKSITDVGALVHFLPPYSPDLAPIEETFSKVKTTLKSIESGMIHITDIETLVLLSFMEVTPEDCKGWIYSTGVHYWHKYNFIAFEELSVYFAFVPDIHSHPVCDLRKAVVSIVIVRNSSSVTQQIYQEKPQCLH